MAPPDYEIEGGGDFFIQFFVPGTLVTEFVYPFIIQLNKKTIGKMVQ